MINRNPWVSSWNRLIRQHICFLLRRLGRHDYLGDGFLEEKKKRTKHRRMLFFKPKANQQRNQLRAKQRKCGNRCNEKVEGSSGRNDRTQTCKHTDGEDTHTHTTTPPRRKQPPKFTSKPEAGRKSSPRQNTTAVRLLLSPPPSSRRNTPLIPPRKNKNKSWTVGCPSPIQSPAPGLAWPDFLPWCPPACGGATDAKWWWMMNGQTLGGGRGAVWKWMSEAWVSLVVGYGDVGRADREEEKKGGDRRGGEEEREGRVNKGRCCFFVSLPCLWRTYVSWCWRPGWYWWT